MTPIKMFYLMLGAVALTITFGVVSFTLAEKGLTNRATSIADLKADLEVVQQQSRLFEATKDKVEELSFVNEIAGDFLPEEKSQAEAVAQFKKFAEETGVTIRAIEFTGGDDVGDPSLSQTSKVEGVEGVRVIELNMTLKEGLSYDQFVRLLEKIESNQRKMQVTNISIIPNSENRNSLSSATLSVKLFLKG